MNQLDTIVASLRQEKADLEARVSRLDAAIDALAGTSAGLKQAAEKATKSVVTKRTRKPMTAAQKKLVSARMKKYWAARRRAAK